MAKRKQQSSSSQTLPCLYIADMNELLPYDSKRKGQSSPLSWIKFRTPALPPARESGEFRRVHQLYLMKRNAIKTREHGFEVLGIYDEILAIYGGNRRAALRGWLVNCLYQPSGVAEIAQEIGHADARAVEAAIETLRELTLLVAVDLPNLEEADRLDRMIVPREFIVATKPVEHAEGDDAPQQRGEEPDESLQKQAENAEKTQKRPDGVFFDARESFRNADGTPPGDVRRETPDGETSSACGLGETSCALETATAAPSPGPTGDGQTNDGGTAYTQTPAAAGTQQQPTGEQAGPLADVVGRVMRGLSPAGVAEPLKPTEADRQQGQEQSQGLQVGQDGLLQANETEADMRDGAGRKGLEADSAARLASDIFAGGNASRNLAERTLAALYATRDKLVMESRKSRLSHDDATPQSPDEFAKREIACFEASWLAVLELRLKSDAFAGLVARATKEAEQLSRKSTRKPAGAVWRYWLNMHMQKAVGVTRWGEVNRWARKELDKRNIKG